MSKHPYADDGAEHLAPIKPLAVAWVGSSRPVGLASWIKRLDCASSYSSTSSSRRFQPARPIVLRCEARSCFSYFTRTCCRDQVSPDHVAAWRLTATWLE
jgi:hypothetical protein